MQENRLISVTSPLGKDVLLFHQMSGTEPLGRLFQYDLDFFSKDDSINLDEILGQNISIAVRLPDETDRYFNGFISRFSQHGTMGEYHYYRAEMRPWLWLLTRTSNCRIFQQMTVPDIVKKVCKDKGFTDIEDHLTGTYRTWVYCVQYRETDFNFISRLLEQEGIYFYFKHEQSKHLLVLADSISAHQTVGGYENIPYFPVGENVEQRERDHINELSFCQTVQPGCCALTDYDFEKPKASLFVKSSVTRSHAFAEFEQFDYPGEYSTTDDGDSYANSRIQEFHAGFEQVEGSGNVRGLTTGSLFSLSNYPRVDQNREYLVVSTHYYLQSDEYFSGAEGSGGEDCQCSFSVIDSKQIFKPQRLTPKPMVQGPQTAVVVGPAGEEIYTNKHGQVKVQFHWDREGGKDENSSCWIRVSHPIAGKGWGSVTNPRIGQEVIVEFLEGDPDAPIITGTVYNADQMPPYELPANQSQSGFKSRSTKGGGAENFNEIRFEDKMGEEEVYIHAEKDQNNVVENDETTSVGHDRTEDVGNDETITIGNNRTEKVGNNEDITIGNNRTEKVGVNETINIGSSRSVTIGSNKMETIAINKAETIGVAKELTIGGAYAVTVGAAMNEAIGAAKAEEIGAVKSVNVGLNSSENVGKTKSVDAGDNISESAGKDVSIKSGKKMSLSAGDDFSVQGKKKGVIDIADELAIKCGKASILMKNDGTITLQGKDITIKGSGGINVKADGNITMNGKKILQN